MGSKSALDVPSFTEKGFYLSEFRGRTLGVVLDDPTADALEPVNAVLKELEANRTRVVLLAPPGAALDSLPDTPRVPGSEAGPEALEGRVWRCFSKSPRVGIGLAEGTGFAPACSTAVAALGLTRVLWLDRDGGLSRADGSRQAFVDLAELRELVTRGATPRAPLLAEIQRMLSSGCAAVTLCSSAGLADELFTYAGSGTMFRRERYVVVRHLGIDDFDAADDLVNRGVSEGYLAPRSPEQVDAILSQGFGAFVEGAHLAGIGALLQHESPACGEISALYTLTRFVGEGVGAHLVARALERAHELHHAYVFACTTSDRVVGFFERQGFRQVKPDEVPAAKWQGYDPERRASVRCLRRDLA